MRVLMLSAHLPWHGHGGGVVVGNLLRQLSRRHEVTLVTYFQPEEEHHLQEAACLCQHFRPVHWQRSESMGSSLSSLPPSSRPVGDDVLRRAWRRLPPAVRSSIYDLRQAPGQWRAQWREQRRQPWPEEVVWRQTRSFAAALARELESHHFDLVLAEWPEMALYGLQAPESSVRVLDSIELRSVTDRRYFYNSDLKRKVWWLCEWRKMQRLESMITQRYDVVTAISQKEGRQLARLHGKADIIVNPVGLNLAGRARQDVIVRRTDTLIFLGRMSYSPNPDAVHWFLQCYPTIRAVIPNVRFLIVGGNPPPDIQALSGRDGITVTGYVPDLSECLATATLFVLPMRLGGGIKVKALEAMACGLPIVATRAGAEGLDAAVDGQDILIAQTPGEFAAKTIQLLKDADLRRRIAASARDMVWKRYNSETNVTELEELYMAKVRLRRQVGTCEHGSSG